MAGVVARAKSWLEAATVAATAALLKDCTPSETVRMESQFVTSNYEILISNDGLLDTEGEVEKAEADFQRGQEGKAPAADFCGMIVRQYFFRPG